MAFLDFLLGKEGQFKQAPSRFDQPQQQAVQSLLPMGLQGLGTDAIERQARAGFQRQTIPLLSTRFAAANAGGTSGYQNALQQEGTDLELGLAAQRQRNAMNLLRLGLTPYQGETYYEPGTEGIAGDLAMLAARAGLAYGTGGLSEAGFGIKDLFKSLFGEGQSRPSSYTGIEAEKTAPLQRRLAAQSPLTSLGQAAGINRSLFSGGRYLGEQPLASSAPEALNQLRRPGTMNAISLLNQGYQAGLPQAARESALLASLARPYPGFEL